MSERTPHNTEDLYELLSGFDMRLDRIEQWQKGTAENAIHTHALLAKLTDQVVSLQKNQAVVDYRLAKSDKIITGVSIVGIMGFIGFLASGTLLMFQNTPQTGGTP